VSIIDEYEAAWREAGHPGDPQSMIAISAVCAETEEQAALIAASQAYWKVMAFRHGIREPLNSPEEALNLKAKLSLSDQAYFDETLASVVHGTVDQCHERLQALAARYRTDELALVTVTYDYEDRLDSYRRLAQLVT